MNAAAAAKVRRAYAAAGWHLWRAGPLYYATTSRSRYSPGQGETLWSDTPVGVLRKALAHPSGRWPS